MSQTIQNSFIEITVAEHGAELRSIKDTASGREYLWQADPAYWPRTSPILFPVVGRCRDNTSIYNGKEYTILSHGFARDMDFTLVSQTEGALLYALEESAETLERYPFPFRLEIGYRLAGRSVVVSWKVINKTEDTMYFSIGGHPAFLCTIGEDAIELDASGMLCSQVLEDGLVSGELREVKTEDGRLLLTDELFARNALIFEDGQVHRVTIIRADGKRLLTVAFDAPLVGIWSPVGKHAPFICIEPWYGRADREGFSKQLTEREHGNALPGGESFTAEYSITVE